MAISSETQKAIDHYKALRDLLGNEEVAVLKNFADWFMQTHDLERVPQPVEDAIGLLCDIFDPEAIAEQDPGFTEGEEHDRLV